VARRPFESWRLFWVLAIAIGTANCLGLPSADFHTARGTEFIILYAVLCALPFLLIAFTASSLATLWPSPITRWMLANRRYFGLAFAFGMSWHFAFVGYYLIVFGDPIKNRDLILDLIGLCFLLAMTLTSFQRFARRLSLAEWHRLHKTGIYVLWFLPTFFYLGNLRSHWDMFHFWVLSVLLAALILRGIARAKKSVLFKRISWRASKKMDASSSPKS
jgi:sulfoxide reductase heme-binding subunit YedZ